jgi:inner membrane protein
MDNVTHSLIGLAASKAGLEKLSPGATTLCILAANSPDFDIVALAFGGRWAYLHHHRGITHSIVGALVLALALPLVFYLGDWIIARLRKRTPTVKLAGLLVASLIATATHPLMDWTNNYGMRFLLPWSSRWSYGDFVFIVDPFIWIVLGGAGFLLTSKTKKQVVAWIVLAVVTSCLVLVGLSGLTQLANPIVIPALWIVALIVLVALYRRRPGPGQGAKVAIAALAIVTLYLGGLAIAHSLALRQAQPVVARIAAEHGEQVVKSAAMPTVANPAEWICVLETNRATYRFSLSLLRDGMLPSSLSRFEKPTGLEAEAVAEAERDYRSQVFLGFARFPAMGVLGEDCATQTLVQFADIRYTEPGRGRGTFSLEVPVDCPIENGATK